MKQAKHWQEYGNVVLGLWLLTAPVVLGFADRPAAVWNTAIIGVLLLAAAAGALLLPRRWEDWTETALAGWLIVSPLFIEFNTQIGASNALITGLLVLTLSLWAIVDQQVADRNARSPAL